MNKNLTNDLLSDDECKCIYCSAIMFIPFNGKQIPVTQSMYDDMLFKGFRPLFPLDKIISFNSRYIPFIIPLKTKK